MSSIKILKWGYTIEKLLRGARMKSVLVLMLMTDCLMTVRTLRGNSEQRYYMWVLKSYGCIILYWAQSIIIRTSRDEMTLFLNIQPSAFAQACKAVVWIIEREL